MADNFAEKRFPKNFDNKLWLKQSLLHLSSSVLKPAQAVVMFQSGKKLK
jgi:hypothetical protein